MLPIYAQKLFKILVKKGNKLSILYELVPILTLIYTFLYEINKRQKFITYCFLV